jgi:phage terminase large subunit
MREAGDWFISLYEWNDAPKLSHWTYDYMREMEQREDAYVKKTNYNDAPKWQQELFLGKPLLKEIEMMKDVNPELYKSEYLGFPANLGGTVYKQFSRERNVKPATHEYIDITIGVDVGGNDATVYTAKGFKPNYSGMETFATYYHKNGVTGGIKNINEYVQDLLEFCTNIYARYKKPVTVFIDSANLMFKQLVEEYAMTNEFAFIIVEPLPKMKRLKGTNKNKSILQGRVDMNEIMFGSGYHTIDPSCINSIKAFEEREYNKNGEPADDGSSDVDSIDSSDYGWLKEMDFIYEIIMR